MYALKLSLSLSLSLTHTHTHTHFKKRLVTLDILWSIRTGTGVMTRAHVLPACPLHDNFTVLIHEPFRPHGCRGPPGPDLKRIVCQQLRASVLNCPFTIHHAVFQTGKQNLPANERPPFRLNSRKGQRSQRTVTRVVVVARLNTSTFSLI